MIHKGNSLGYKKSKLKEKSQLEQIPSLQFEKVQQGHGIVHEYHHK